MTDHRFRVALVCASLGYAGSERQLVYMAQSLKSVGVDVAFYNAVRSDFFFRKLHPAAIPCRYYGRLPHPVFRMPNLVGQILRFRPHVIQCAQIFVNGYVALAAKIAGAKAIGALRSDLRTSLANLGPRTTRFLLRFPDAIVTNSARLAEELRHEALVEASRVHFLRNRLDLDRFRADRVEANGAVCMAITVGRLQPGKRIDVFIRALAAARARGANVRGLVVGDGSERTRLQTLARTCGLTPEQLHFAGFVDDAAPYLRRANLLVHCSESEGSPNAILEGMASGLPIVTTPVGNAPDLVTPGANGFLFPFGDVEALTRHLQTVAASAALRAKAGAESRLRAERDFGLDNLADSLLAIYRAAGAQHPFLRRSEREVHA